MSSEWEELDSGMFGSNTPAWHGNGRTVKGQPGAAAAIAFAGLDQWKCIKEPVYSKDGVQIPDVFITCRDDLEPTDERRFFGPVGGSYHTIQAMELAGFCDRLGQGGAAFETMGSLRNGRLIFMTAKLPGTTKVHDDVVDQWLLLMSSHDGSYSVNVMFTPIRVVCWNTLSAAMRGAKVQATVRHTGNYEEQLNEAQRVLGIGQQYYTAFGQSMEELARQKVNSAFVEAYLKALFPGGVQYSKVAESRRADVARLFYGEQCGADQDACRGTAYGLLNAALEWNDHRREFRTRTHNVPEARMSSILFGTAAEFRSKATRLALHSEKLLAGASN